MMPSEHHPLLRESGNQIYVVEEDGKEKIIAGKYFDATNGIDGIIRIQEGEYGEIDRSLRFFTHFNLEQSQNLPGYLYALPRIVRAGYYKSEEDETSPLLSFQHVYEGVCKSVREFVPYEKLKPDDFQFSMKHIRNGESLKAAILKRYCVSLPNLTKEEILERGVSVTTLKLKPETFDLEI